MSQLSAFHRRFEVRWADLDANSHMRHSAYLDFPAQVRVSYFNSHGFSVRKMQELGVGPILFNESVEYRREVRDSELIDVDVALIGLSENQKHWYLRHQIFKESGELAAVLLCRGAWIDLNARRVCAAPDGLYQSMLVMPRTDDFEWIVSQSASAS
jgi:acyl-CoA thioester hydrolase